MEKYNYDNDVITERIRELKDERFKYDCEFAEEIGIKKDTLRKRLSDKNYKNPWKISELMDICNVFGCDLDFLVGAIDKPTHEIQSVTELTGLNEKACEKILEYSTDTEKPLIYYIYRIRAIHLLSWLLENGLLEILDGIASTNNIWWNKYSYSPKISDYDLMMMYAEKASDEDGGYIFFPTEPDDKEDVYWNAVSDSKVFKSDLYDAKEKISSLIDEYCIKNRSDDEQLRKAIKIQKEWFKQMIAISEKESEG